MTFSIVATDGTAWGVAVASKFIAVGSVVPGVRESLGAVATQAAAKVSYVPDLLEALSRGQSAADALAAATAADPGREERQVGVVGMTDEATWTGAECMDWAGGRTGRDGPNAFAIQGNILVGEQVVADMEEAWRATDGKPLHRRLMAALLAGDAAGGDRRGRQSAAIIVRSPGAGYDSSGVAMDLRVDEHPAAPTELARLVDLAELYFGHAEDVRVLDGGLREEVRGLLDRVGVTGGSVESDLADWAGEVNLETRLSPDGIDARVLEELRAAAAG
jgi:uncharacterized Ntn-hydrolase superfamily protein